MYITHTAGIGKIFKQKFLKGQNSIHFQHMVLLGISISIFLLGLKIYNYTRYLVDLSNGVSKEFCNNHNNNAKLIRWSPYEH